MKTEQIMRPLPALQQHARRLSADMDTPISLFLGMASSGNGILLESAEVDGRWGRYSILACDTLLIVRCRQGNLALEISDERLEPLRVFEGRPFVEALRALMQNITILPPPEITDLPPITRALYGYFGFGTAGLFNPKLASIMPPEEADCILALPGTVLVFDHLYNRLTQISLGEHCNLRGLHKEPELCGVNTLSRQANQAGQLDAATICTVPDQAGHTRNVERIREMLRQGEAIQVVPSVRFSTPFTGDAFDLYRRLRRRNASPYMFFMRFDDLTLFGSSPEVMVRCTDGQLQLSPIAGTRPRGKDEMEDARLAAELREDPKERAEHVMLVDLGRNDLGRIARPGSVNLERCMEVERFSHVMHLTSRVSARLAEGLDALDVLAATFPAGTVSGAPKLRALEIIRELEGRPRGPYAGCIGWLGLDKDGVHLDTGITIRSLWVRDGMLYWQAGGGIVHDSDPHLEWQEICNKSAVMRLALRAEEDTNVFAHR